MSPVEADGDPLRGGVRLVVIATRSAIDTLSVPFADEDADAGREGTDGPLDATVEWIGAEAEPQEGPIPVQAGNLLARIAPTARPFHLVGVGEQALLTFEAAAQLASGRRPPAGLTLVDPPPVPSATEPGGYRPPLLDLPGLLILTPDRTPLGPDGAPATPDPRLEWVAQYRHAPKLVRVEGSPFDLHDGTERPHSLLSIVRRRLST